MMTTIVEVMGCENSAEALNPHNVSAIAMTALQVTLPQLRPRHAVATGSITALSASSITIQTSDGNTVTATTRHVAAFTLLLSPDQFDFSKPVKVVADGQTVFEGMVKKDVATLLKWAAKDNDRTMLFGAELPIRLAN